MTQIEIKQLHDDIETLKNDVALIKHILSQEGELTDIARERLSAARKTPLSKYAKL